jgi:GNAT superfamily N-acetyltransferase
MKVRDANEADLKALYEFEKEIICTERKFDSTLQDEDFHYYDFKDLIISQDVKIVVVEVDNEVVGSGFAQMKKAENYLKHAAYAYVGLLYVKPLHRGKGINSVVLQTLKDWIRKRGITEIRLVVYETNEAARIVYQKAGFIPHVLEMRMEI